VVAGEGGWLSAENSHDVGLLHDEEFIAVDLDLGA
jgi:hypothetical protein